MNTCRLDHLPVELIHHLLSYFSAHEIFYTFINVTSYVNAVLAAYSNYRINCKAITRANFDLVCQYIKPDQVIALTLANDEDTPGLIDLFLSRFQINQFTRLQSLRMIEIGADFWENIITQMVELKYLQSFCYFPCNRSDRWICKLPSDDVTQLDKSLFNTYAPLLPQLYKLRLCHGDYLNSIQFPHLHHLILERSSVNLIKYICSVAPQLKSLVTSFSDDVLITELIFPLPQLNRLVLHIQGFDVSMNALEQMMSNLPRLQHLELIVDCINDVVDGNRWQIKAKYLVTFKFMFHLSNELESQGLDSFRSSFWLEEKRWFVAYTHRHVFSVPHFLATEADENFQLPQYSTVPDNRIFYECIDKLQLTEKSSPVNGYFPHVQTLVLCCTAFLPTIDQIVDLSRVQHFIFSSLVENFPIKRLINEMPNLRQISFRCDLGNFLKQVRYETFDTIRTLQIGNSFMKAHNFDIEHLCAVFPNIEHLQVDYKCSTMQIFDFLDRFKRLSTASFHYISWYENEDVQQCRLEIQTVLDRVRRVQRLNYTYQFDCSSVHFWI